MRRPTIMALSMLAVTGLCACSSTQDVLEPSAITPTSPETSTDATASTPPSTGSLDGAASVIPVPAASTASPASGQNAALVASARIQFAPIVGTSVEAATALSERLAVRARQRGMRLTGSADMTTTHVIKGYFTPLTEGRQTTVIYVWDVYDPAGSRVHRISGQQKFASAGGEGWQTVTPETMQMIADQTIDQLATWLGGQTG